MNTRNRENEGRGGRGQGDEEGKEGKGRNKKREKKTRKEPNLFHSLEAPRCFLLFCSTNLNEIPMHVYPPQA